MIKSFTALFLNRDYFSRRNITICALLGIGLALFITIYDSVLEHDGLASLDGPIRTWVANNQSAGLTAGMKLITDLSAPLSISVITIIGAVIWYIRKKDFWRPALTLGAVAISLTASAIIKTLTARERPTITDLIDAHASVAYSFPSGHTIGAATLLLVLAYFYCAKAPSMRRFVITSLIFIVSIALVAFSRIYLGYHWLTDVTASIGLAFVVLAIAITIDTYAKPRKQITSSKEV
jgi:undecaprenyl-diphosphatase